MTTQIPPNILARAVEQSFSAVLITDARMSDGGPGIVYANPRFLAMTGYSLGELLGRSPRQLQGPQTDPAVLQRLRECLREGRFFEGDAINYRKDGSPYHVQWNISPIRDEEGAIQYFISVQHDITARVAAEAHRDLLARALDATAASVLITDASGAIVFANQALQRQTGYRLDELLGRNPSLLGSGQHGEEFYAGMWERLQAGETFRSTFINRDREGRLYHAEQTITPAIDANGRPTHFISISKDISERVDNERQLRQIAERDVLTGLYNRRYGERFLKELASGSAFSVMLCDIDHFKSINDRHGHALGDRALQACSAALLRCIRQSDVCVRWGGEEFLLLLPDCSLQVAARLGERILAAVRECRVDGVSSLSVSIGLAQKGRLESPLAVIERADAALYAAKRGGRDRLELAVEESDGAPAD